MFRKEQLKELYDECRSSVIGSILIAIGIYLINSNDIGKGQQALTWIYLVWIIASIRGFDAVLYFKTDKAEINDTLFLIRFAIGIVLIASSWGLLFWNTFPNASQEYQAFIILIEMAILSFATMTLFYHLGVLLLFQVIVTIPIELSLLNQNTIFYTVLSIWVPTFFIFQAIAAIRMNKKYRESIGLQLELKQKIKDNQNLQYAVDQHGVVSITDTEGTILYANDKMLETTLYTKDELVGVNHRIVNSGEHSDKFWEGMYQTIAGGKVWHAEIKNKAKDGRYFWMDSTIVPFINEQGIPYQYISIRTDITKLKELEQQNLNDKNDALIRAEVSQILQGQSSLKERVEISLKAISKAVDLKIQNKLGVFILPEGSDKLEMFVTHGQYTKDFLTREKCVKLGSCLCGRAALSGELIVSDDCFSAPYHEHSFEGMVAHGHYIVPLRHNGKILGILFIYTETYPSREESRLDTLRFIGDMFGLAIANERVKQEMHQARKNAEAMAQAKSDFLANMSHEIRTPMNGVLGMLELLSHIDLDDKSKGYVDIAHGSANMLLNVINDILDISKIESGKLHIEHIDFDLRKAIEDTTELLSKLAYQKNIELSCFIPPEIKTLLQGDVMRLQQVLNNLISNAIKFTSEGEVSVSISTIEESDNKTKLRFEIKDTGIGIPADKQGKLFQAFTQADTSTSREFGGTGLGLAISKSLIEMMGGKLGLVSEVGKGSTFWFELPFDIIKDNKLPFTLDNLRILTIDDNETNCLILRKYIENWSGENFTETNSEIGLYRLQEAVENNNPFDILLLDMQMPGVTGQEVAVKIRQNPIFNNLKIILLSSMGLDYHTDNHKYFDLLLNKPIRQSLLYDAISTVQNLAIKVEKKPKTKKEFVNLNGKLLFVDDNLVNQHLGKAMLTSFGLDFEIVSNGQEALDARKNKAFDLILMDCQMPVMDGFEATRQIRQYEAQTEQEKITIVALTANAMQGDREKCLSVGMDDYITKPYTVAGLSNTLSKWLTIRPTSDDKVSITIKDSKDSDQNLEQVLADAPIINSDKFEETREMMGEDVELIIDAFLDSGATLTAEMKKCSKEDDIDGLRNAFHALKGSCGVLGVQRLFDHCKEAEERCRVNDLGSIDTTIAEIFNVFEDSSSAIQELMLEKEI